MRNEPENGSRFQCEVSLRFGSGETTLGCGMLSFFGLFSGRRRRRDLVLIFQNEQPSPSRAARGKVGNLGLVVHFPRRGPPELWECGNLAGLARFPRGGGKSGKPAFGFPLFPRTRHFHSSFSAGFGSPWNGSLGAPRLRQQRQLGFLHLLRRLRIAHT